jgi:hypothetical protein
VGAGQVGAAGSRLMNIYLNWMVSTISGQLPTPALDGWHHFQQGPSVGVEFLYDEDPLFLGAVALAEVPFAEILVAVDALEGSEVEVVFAVGAHVRVVPFLEGDHAHFCEGAVLVESGLDQDVLAVEDAAVLLHHLSGKGGVPCRGRGGSLGGAAGRLFRRSTTRRRARGILIFGFGSTPAPRKSGRTPS